MVQVSLMTSGTLVNFLRTNGVEEPILSYVRQKEFDGCDFVSSIITEKINEDLPEINTDLLEDIRQKYSTYEFPTPFPIPCISVEEFRHGAFRFKCPMSEIETLEPGTALISVYFAILDTEHRLFLEVTSNGMMTYRIQCFDLSPRKITHELKIINKDDEKSLTRKGELFFGYYGSTSVGSKLIPIDSLSHGFISTLDVPVLIFEIRFEPINIFTKGLSALQRIPYVEEYGSPRTPDEGDDLFRREITLGGRETAFHGYGLLTRGITLGGGNTLSERDDPLRRETAFGGGNTFGRGMLEERDDPLRREITVGGGILAERGNLFGGNLARYIEAAMMIQPREKTCCDCW